MEDVQCPKCGELDWNAVEQFQALTPCRLVREKTGEVETVFDMRAELARSAATSVILAYACATADCGYTISAAELQEAQHDRRSR